jgi:tetratricopeptide (TPR) repeat protein
MRRSLLLLLLCALSLPLSAATVAEHITAGRAALDRDEHDKAVDLFSKAVALQPNHAEAHYLLGVAYGQLAQEANILKQASLAKKTKTEFERAVELDPNFLDARFALIDYYLIAPGIMGGSQEKALAQAAEIKKRSALDGHAAYARVYSRQKKVDLARKEYVDAVRGNPKSARAHYMLAGFLINNDKDWKGALHELDMAITLDPAFMPAYVRLGAHAALSGSNYTRGEEALRKYLTYKRTEKEPSHATAWYWLGLVQEKQGKKGEAKVSYQNALKLAPNEKEIREALKRVS